MTKPKYRRLTYDDRIVIENMRKAKKTQSEIANAIGVSQSTISRELSRNRVEGVYMHGRAFMRTYLRLLLKPKRYLIGENEADILRQFWNYYRSNAELKFDGFNKLQRNVADKPKSRHREAKIRRIVYSAHRRSYGCCQGGGFR